MGPVGSLSECDRDISRFLYGRFYVGLKLRNNLSGVILVHRTSVAEEV